MSRIVNSEVLVIDNRKQVTSEPIRVLMFIDAESYPNYPYPPVVDGDLKKFNSFKKSISYILAERLISFGFSLRLIGMNHFTHKSTLRYFGKGNPYTNPKFNKEYTSAGITSNIINNETTGEDGVFYTKLDFRNRTTKLVFGDYVQVITHVRSYLIWFGTSTDSDPPLNRDYFTIEKKFEYNSTTLLADQMKELEIYLNGLGFYIVPYSSSNQYLTFYKHIKYPQAVVSRFDNVVDTNLLNDILSERYEDLKVFDFWSNYNTIISDLKVYIEQVNSYQYRVIVSQLNENGRVLYEENFLVDFNLQSTEYLEKIINDNSELVRCKVYRNDNSVDITGTYYLRAQDIDVPAISYSHILRELDKVEFLVEDTPDIILDSGFLTKDFYDSSISKTDKDFITHFTDKLISLAQDRVIVCTHQNKEHNRHNLIQFVDTVAYNDTNISAYLVMFEILSNSFFNGEVPSDYTKVSSLPSSSFLNGNELEEHNYGIYQNTLFMSSGRSFKTSLGLIRISNYIQRNIKDSISSYYEYNHFINSNLSLFKRLSWNTIISVTVYDYNRKEREVKVTLEYVTNDKEYVTYYTEINFYIL